MPTPKQITKEERESIRNALHHLRKWRGRPYWLKLRIDQGPKFVGKNVYVPIHTKNLKVAEIMRDCVLDALHKGGFICLRHTLMTEEEKKKEA